MNKNILLCGTVFITYLFVLASFSSATVVQTKHENQEGFNLPSFNIIKQNNIEKISPEQIDILDVQFIYNFISNIAFFSYKQLPVCYGTKILLQMMLW